MQIIVGFFVLVFIFALMTGMDFGSAFFLTLAIGAFLIGIAVLLINDKANKMKAQLDSEGGRLVGEHIAALVRRYRQLNRTDEYGLVDSKAWEKERTHFFNNVVIPALPYNDGWSGYGDHFNKTILEPRVKAAFEEQRNKFASQFDPEIAPIDYEHFCAERLRQLGWDAKVTKSAGDQGADVVATMDDDVMVVQCKRYAKAVGNKAVQEIVGAMKFYSADYAIVIATNGYTKAARALAEVNDVILLHHDDLAPGWEPR